MLAAFVWQADNIAVSFPVAYLVIIPAVAIYVGLVIGHGARSRKGR